MSKNTLAVIAVILILRNRSQFSPGIFHNLNSLQLESLLDNLHSAIHAIEKVSSFSQSELATSLPDMKKILEVVENLPL